MHSQLLAFVQVSVSFLLSVPLLCVPPFLRVFPSLPQVPLVAWYWTVVHLSHVACRIVYCLNPIGVVWGEMHG